LPVRYRSLVIFVCQLLLKLRLATLPNKIALRQWAEGNKLICGEGGIRTPGTFDSTPDFESGTLNRSDTSPLV
jgi:hypothetical protein